MLKKGKQMIAIVLVIIMALTNMSIEVLAQTAPEEQAVSSKDVTVDSNTEIDDSSVTVMGELVEKREANIKHFRMSDGSIKAAVYPKDVHYKDENGDYVDIDNSLVEEKDDTDDVLSNQKNEFQVKFMKKSNKNKLYTLNKGKDKITVSIDGVRKVKAKTVDASESLKAGDNDFKVSNISSQMLYRNIFQNVDLEYTIVSKELKENIILKEEVDFQSIIYNYKIGNHHKVVAEDEKNIKIVDKDSDEVILHISAPIMWDANRTSYDNLTLQIVEGKNTSIKIKLSWKLEKDMVYPITIDPVLSFSTNRLEIQDTYIVKSRGTENFNAHDHIKLRNDGYALLDFPTPDLSSGDKIVHAELVLAPYMFLDDATSDYSNTNSYNPALYITAHKILREWNEKTVTYQSAGADSGFYDSTVYACRILDSDNDFYTWDITRLASEWTEGGAANHGVLLKFDKTPSNGSIANAFFCSTNGRYNPVEYYPQILYQYINTNGLEDYLSYHSQDLGYAGTAHVNDLTGQLTVVTPLLQTGGNIMPISVSLIYNNESYTVDTYGHFWNLNWFQYIEKVTSNTFNGVKYRDEDGTEHYFKYNSENNNYVDEINSNRVLTLNSDTLEFKMMDDNNNSMHFKKSTTRDIWYLTKSEDAHGNYIIAELDYNYIFRVNRLYSSTGNEVDFEYTQAGFLSKVKYHDGDVEKIISLDYNTYVQTENRSLGKITFPDNTYLQYHYTEGTCDLSKIVDIDGSSYHYEFSSGTPKRIKKVTEYSSDNTMGQQMTLTYEPTATYITDVTNNRKYLYTFVTTGTLKSVVDITSNDGNGYAQYYEYNNGNTTETKDKDKLTFISKTQKSTVNMLRDHSFENQLTTWPYQAWNQTTGISSAVLSSTTAYLGTNSYQLYRSSDCDATRVLAYGRIDITLGQQYTLSAYVNTKDMTSQGQGASVYVVGEYFEFESEYITEAKNEWQRISVTFVAPITGKASVCLSMVGCSGYTYFDCVQVEKGDLSDYNILQNAGFEGLYGATAEGWATVSNDAFLSSNEHISGNYSLGFHGEPHKDKEYQQVIYINGSAGDTYVASAFAKADSVPASGWQFTLLIQFVRWGSIINAVTIPFNSYTTDWQKVSGVAKADGYYTAIVLHLLYCENANDVYFDNVQFVKDNFGSTYTYDEKGNLTSTVDLQGKQEYSFNYDGNNQLIKQTNLSGGKISYSYNKDVPTQLSMATSGGVGVRYEYDSKGNALSSTSVGSELIEGKYYYIQCQSFCEFFDLENRSNANGTLIKYNKSDQSAYQRWKLIKNTDGTYGLSPECAPGMLLSTESASLYDGAKVCLYSNGSAPHQKLNITKLKGNIYRIDFATASGYSLDGNLDGCYAYYTHSGEYQQFAFILAEDSGTEDNPVMTSSATYSDNGEYMKTITDSRGNTTQYEYNESRGYVDYTTASDGTITDYTYNGSELLTNVSVSKDNQTTAATYNYDTAKRLSNITSPSGTTYNFTYDTFSRNNNINVGNNRTLSNYIYNGKGLLDQLIYGNGITVKHEYDKLNRQTETKINNVLRYQYTYDGSSRLLETIDVLGNQKLKYAYDILDRLTVERILDTTTKTELAKLRIRYDDSKNRVSGYDVNIGNTTKSTDYIYGELTKAPDIITGVKKNGTRILTYGYDALNRLQTRTISTTTPFVTEYEYLEGATSGTTTTLVDTVKNGNDTLTYTYDNMGNITSVSKNGTLIESYTYDYLNQLKTVTRGTDTYEYIYDNGGNILSVKRNGETIKTYNYGDSEWKDLLSTYNGETINYDTIGNPLTYRAGMNFTWTDGRKLTGITKGTDSISYTYDSNGLRNSKTVNGTTTEYYWLNGMLQGQKSGNEYILFLYDESGSVYGFILKNGTEESSYYYEFNLQGDIIGIIDSNGNRVVEYTYNEWGQILSITGTLADTIGQINPLRYRGYYYDAETGFYLTGTRYYDPEIGRFINADGYVSTGQGILGNNMFAYCGNNPINRIDPTGQLWSSILNFVKTAVSAIGKAIASKAPAYASVGGVTFIDGPLLIADSLAAIGALAITADAICQGMNQTFQARDASEDKEDAKVISNTKQQKRQAYFPADPYQFTPKGLVMNEYPGTKNGRIIKWSSPITNSVIFEWNEDIKNGAHYHTMMIEWDGKHIGPHYYAGMKVPEPWNSIYFGGQ